MPGRRCVLGKSNGLAWPCVDPGITNLGLLPGVATGSAGISEGGGSASGSERKRASSFSTMSRIRSGVAWSGFSDMCFLCSIVSECLGCRFTRLTSASCAPLKVWWYISLYSSSFAASSAAASSLRCWLSSAPATEARRDLFCFRCCKPCMRIAAMTTLTSASLFRDSVVGSSGCMGTVATCDRFDRLACASG